MSFPPLSGAMNPYPFVGLNHFTVPFGIDVLPFPPGAHEVAPCSTSGQSAPPFCRSGFPSPVATIAVSATIDNDLAPDSRPGPWVGLPGPEGGPNHPWPRWGVAKW